ncbi:MAG: ABC transporter ATP-binding protein [Alphaproteobacteria bacterium]|nr:ABC transporter ATP-binding protein [Alphaproteobacteria bacterium]
MTDSTKTLLSALHFLWSYWMRYPRVVIATGFTLALMYLGNILVPVMAGRLVDAVALGLSPAAYEAASAALLGLVLVIALSQVARRLSFYLWVFLASEVMTRMVEDGFAKVQRFSTAWHAENFAGATVRKLTRGMWAYDLLADTLFFGIIPTVCMLAGLTVMLTLQWWLMGLVFAVLAIAYIWLSVVLSIRYVGPAMTVQADEDSRLGGVIADAISCNAVVKSFGAEAREEARLGEVAASWRAKARHAWNRSVSLGALQAAMLLLMLASLIGLALYLWGNGYTGAGTVGVALTTFLVMDGYLRDVGMHINNLQKSVSEIADLVAFTRARPSIGDRAAAGPLRVTKGAIAFENVVFHYGDHPEPLFDGLNVRIEPGERVALVGHSGSGKSTFVRLLQRLFEVTGGRITIDGHDIASVAQESLRASMAVVPQDPALFHRTLAENIAYGRPGARMDEIEAAARRARAHDFIAGLPQGYQTEVGERGVKLSGGERQRIAIARAFLSAAPILILDEATSSLDSVTETLIQDGLDELMAGRTTLIIAHRLSTVRQVDRILVFEEGRIVEEGSHGALMQRQGGLYRALYETQSIGLSEKSG